MTTPQVDRHINSILTAQTPHAALAKDMRDYARGFPEGLATAFTTYADNLEMCFQHYEYPLRIYAAWMAERAKQVDPSLTPEQARTGWHPASWSSSRIDPRA